MKTMTFVDNGTVSYSNPVRQSLFKFTDSKEARAKALAAADGVREIVPFANVRGFRMTVPMPGHVITDKGAAFIIDSLSVSVFD